MNMQEDIQTSKKNAIKLVMFNLRRVFFILSFCVGIFFLIGEQLLGKADFLVYGNMLMPGYLIFVGLIIGDIIASFMVIKNTHKEEQINKIYVKFYMIGLIIGIVLAALFMYM